DGRGAVAELTEVEPVEPEVDTFDERVLGDDEPGDNGCVVLDALRKASLLELRQEPELTELGQPHGRGARRRDLRPSRLQRDRGRRHPTQLPRRPGQLPRATARAPAAPPASPNACSRRRG